MSEQPGHGSEDPAENEAVAPAPHRHRILVGTLFALAAVVGVFAVLAVWANRQALNTDNWTTTSSRLLQDKTIQDAVAAYTVGQLFNSGVVQSEIKSALPSKLQVAAGPLAAGLQQVAGQLAPKLLASSQVQAAWVEANRTAHRILLKILNGGGSAASTNNGVVTLNLHAIVTQLAASLGVEKQVAAAQATLKANQGTVTGAASQLGVTLPPQLGQLVILRSSELKTAQDFASAISGLALVLPLITFALLIAAVWLSKGHRRRAIRLTGWSFIGIGLFVLLVRRLAGDGVVDGLVKNLANRTAAHHVWAISTTLLYDIAVALVAYGLVFVAAAWLAGNTRPATATRRALAPTLRTRPVACYAVAYAALLLLIIWGPTPATRQLPYIIGFIVLIALGIHALRLQTAAEFPDAQAGEATGAIRAWGAGRRGPSDSAGVAAPAGNGGRLADLERLSVLHDRGSLTDEEFAAEKAGLIGGPGPK